MNDHLYILTTSPSYLKFFGLICWSINPIHHGSQCFRQYRIRDTYVCFCSPVWDLENSLLDDISSISTVKLVAGPWECQQALQMFSTLDLATSVLGYLWPGAAVELWLPGESCENKIFVPSHGVCMESSAQIFFLNELGYDCEPHFSNLLPWSPAMRLASLVLLPLPCGHACGTAQEGLLGHHETTPSWGQESEVGICVALCRTQFGSAVSINLGALTNTLLSRRDKMWSTPFPKHQTEPWIYFVYSVT